MPLSFAFLFPILLFPSLFCGYRPIPARLVHRLLGNQANERVCFGRKRGKDAAPSFAISLLTTRVLTLDRTCYIRNIQLQK